MLSVCIITKNEETNIERCLASLSGYGFELVVADTGSTDGTREVVKKYTERLYEFPWRDDFAAAKNYVVSKASHDLVLVVDSDEFLQPLPEETVKTLEELAGQNQDKLGRILRRNVLSKDGVYQENREWINRIFDRRKFHYEGRIHEQLVPIDNGRTIRQEEDQPWLSPLIFLHTGYNLSVEEKKKKAQRNISLLKVELNNIREKLASIGKEEEGSFQGDKLQEQIPYLLYQLGKGYYMAGDYETSCSYFAEGLSYDLNPRLEYVVDMVETYGYALLNSGRQQMALCFQQIYEEFGDSADFQFLMGLIYMGNSQFQAAVVEFEKAMGHPYCRNVGVNSYAAKYNIGVIYECLGDIERAAGYYQDCGDYGPALKRLSEIV